MKVEVPTPPSLESLARAIFDTDERVVADVKRYTEVCVVYPWGAQKPYFDKAWSSNRNNWRSEAEARATQILEALKVGQ